MSKEEIATTYEEYKNGFELVAGLGRVSCYQGLDYLEKLLEKDKFYSEELEDTIVFIESHINRIEKENQEFADTIIQLQQENQKYKEVINKAIKWVQDWTYDANDWFEEDSKPSELLDILKEVE